MNIKPRRGNKISNANNVSSSQGLWRCILIPFFIAGNTKSATMSAQAQKCNIKSIQSEVQSSLGYTVEESVYAPFHATCTSDIAYGKAYKIPSYNRICKMTQLSRRFNSLSMNVCDSVEEGALQEVAEACASSSGIFCSTSAIVSGQMSRIGAPSSTEYTYVNIGCIPTCIPLDCTAEENEEAVLSFLSSDVISKLLLDQGFEVYSLSALVPYAQCNDSFSNAAVNPIEVFTTLDNWPHNETYYTVGNALSLALGVVLVASYFAHVGVLFFRYRKIEDEDHDTNIIEEGKSRQEWAGKEVSSMNDEQVTQGSTSIIKVGTESIEMGSTGTKSGD